MRRLKWSEASRAREASTFDALVRQRQLARRRETWRAAVARTGDRKGWLVVSDRGRVPFDGLTEVQAQRALALLRQGGTLEAAAAALGFEFSESFRRGIVAGEGNGGSNVNGFT